MNSNTIKIHIYQYSKQYLLRIEVWISSTLIRKESNKWNIRGQNTYTQCVKVFDSLVGGHQNVTFPWIKCRPGPCGQP